LKNYTDKRNCLKDDLIDSLSFVGIFS